MEDNSAILILMIKLFNTLTGRKKQLKLRKDKPFDKAQGKQINMFVCGPTVYDFSHIGHARTYVAFDIIAKYLRFAGYDVFYLQNITDLDDKIIKRAQEKGAKPLALAREFTREYFKDVKALGITAVSKYALATKYIPEIISQTERLLKKGYAYEIAEGGIYYDVKKFKEYGKLSGRTTQQAEDGVSRIDESVQKRSKADFCLWKFTLRRVRSKEDSGTGFEPFWPSPFGSGRPGWHIEDTAITEKHFGPQYDIHGGARDLIFPHHEAEVAQMEAISGKKPFVRYWLHTGFLTVRGEKMSKSLGNFITIREFLKARSGRLLRFLVAKTHYRSPIDYSENILEQAERELNKLDEFIEKLINYKTQITNSRQNTNHKLQSTNSKHISILIRKTQKEFKRAMEDDMNTPLAIAAIFELIKQGNVLIAENKISQTDGKLILELLKELDSVFGFIFWKTKKQEVPAEIKKLAKLREQYRKEKQWQKADGLRKQIESLGWHIDDIPSGFRLRK